MVLQYFGHDIWPDGLNNWLKTQVDGYLRNGLLNWLAVSRYTRLHDSDTSPTLEYRRITPTVENLKNTIEAGKPGILREPGHFVVGKSILSTSFGINDPAYTSRITLKPYGNTFSSLGVYTPTHTDLSYLYFVIDKDINIKVFDPLNNEIVGFTHIEEPIKDPTNPNAESGIPLKTFMFPTPPDGDYKVIISGEGTYQLDSYIYNEEGNVTNNSFQGILSEGETEKLKIEIGENLQIKPEFTIDSVIQDLDEFWKQGFIRQKHVYQELKFQLLATKKLLAKGKIQPAKAMLLWVKKEISLYTPKYITREASNILRGNLSLLIASL